MASCVRFVSAVLLSLSATVLAQQSKQAASSAPIVQPGAPGQRGKTLSPATLRPTTRTPAEADVAFMQGMIHHHAQAVEMVDLLRTRGQSKELLALGERITISQSDEIKYMKQWLEERGKQVSMSHSHNDHIARMENASVNTMPLMPGMLTPEQMEVLAKAKGAEFDRLFLTGMIQHHTGALIMAEDLFNTPGAGQDSVLFDFATDIDNTQRAEINIMRAMLKEKQ
jgi:uncharacterized protein (DUF305 family)